MQREMIVDAMARGIRENSEGGSRSDAQAALTALEALGLAVLPVWQDIASAPRDGTPFIAKTYVGSTKTGAEWEENHVIWCDDETGEIHPDCEQGWEVDDYSLWMPLPAAPNHATKNKEQKND